MTYQPPPAELVLARLANPLVDAPATDVDVIPWTFVSRNKLDAVLAERDPDRFSSPAGRAERTVVFRTLASLRERFADEDVTFAVIKSLPVVPKPVGDVDILVDDFENTDAILSDRGFDRINRSHLKAVFEKHVDDTRVALHVHESIGWESIEYVSPEDVLSKRTTRETSHGPFPVPSPEHEVLISAAHAIFERGNYKVRLLNVIEAAIHRRERNVAPEDLIPAARAYGWERPLRRYLSAIDRVHDTVYEGPVFGDGYRDVSVPLTPYSPLFGTWLFLVRTVVRDRIDVVVAGASAHDSNHIYIYLGDVLHVISERYGVTYSKRRIRRWLTHIRSTIS